MLDELNALRSRYLEKMDFLLVYIAEAHADDEWPIGSDLVFNQPKSVRDRSEIVEKFYQNTNFEWDCLLDNEKNEFDQVYAAWPLRFYIIDQKQKLSMIAEPHDGGYYNFLELERCIKNQLKIE